MPGEKSKEVGEIGERVVSRLLEAIGWKPFQEKIDIACHNPDYHKKKLKKHGLDYFKAYLCPIQSDSQKTVFISSKYYESYPADPSIKVRDFIEDLGQTMACGKLDPDYGQKRLKKGIKEVQTRGLLFYLGHGDDHRISILSDLKKFRYSNQFAFDPITIVDNRRASFLYSITEFVKTNFHTDSPMFAYAQTENNMDAFETTSFGSILPVEYLASELIPFRVDTGEDKRHLLLFTTDAFSENSLSKLMSFSKNFTNGWNNKTTIYFSDYREMHHKAIADGVKSSFVESEHSQNSFVESFPFLDYRKLEESDG